MNGHRHGAKATSDNRHLPTVEAPLMSGARRAATRIAPTATPTIHSSVPSVAATTAAAASQIAAKNKNSPDAAQPSVAMEHACPHMRS